MRGAEGPSDKRLLPSCADISVGWMRGWRDEAAKPEPSATVDLVGMERELSTSYWWHNSMTSDRSHSDRIATAICLETFMVRLAHRQMLLSASSNLDSSPTFWVKIRELQLASQSDLPSSHPGSGAIRSLKPLAIGHICLTNNLRLSPSELFLI